MRTVYFVMRTLGTACLIYLFAPWFFRWWVTSSNMFSYASAVTVISPSVGAGFPQAEVGLVILVLLCYCAATTATNFFSFAVDVFDYALSVAHLKFKENRKQRSSI